MFDEEGFYRPGDAVRFADPADPNAGLVFDGRTAEDFKLLNGTWVAVGALRVGSLAAASPVLQDAIVTGEGRDQVGLVAWLNAAGCKQVTGEDGDLAGYARHPKVHAHLRDAFAKWNKINTGATMRIARLLLLPDMPSIDAQRNHRQGLHQPARRAGKSRRRSEAAVRRRGASRCGGDRLISDPVKSDAGKVTQASRRSFGGIAAAGRVFYH